MKSWIRLYEQHQQIRDETGEHLSQDLRLRLKRLAESRHCDGDIVGRFNQRKRGDQREWYISGSDASRVTLVGLPNMKEVSLTVLALVDARNHHVHQFTAMLEGLHVDGTPVTVAVHLEDDRDQGDQKGSGACAHAALHCHVRPNQNVEPKIRVPFGAVGPVQALDWLLSTVVPDWEPAPWATVQAVLLGYCRPGRSAPHSNRS